MEILEAARNIRLQNGGNPGSWVCATVNDHWKIEKLPNGTTWVFCHGVATHQVVLTGKGVFLYGVGPAGDPPMDGWEMG